MPDLTAAHVAEVCDGLLMGDAAATADGLVADSREVVEGTAFAAVRGGHAFVGDSINAGAPFVIVDRSDAAPAGATAVIVEDTVEAIGAIATDARSRLNARVVGITGSTGKTLTKDLLASALGAGGGLRVHAAPRSHNTDVTMPLVVAACPADADVLVVEMGARNAGDISYLSQIARPDIAIVTGVGVTHFGVFGSRDAIASTKAELLTALPGSGLAIVPSDDDFLALFAERTAARLATVGPGSAFRYRAERIDALGRTYGAITDGGREIPVVLPIAGRALMRNAALALRAAAELGIDLGDAAEGIAASTPSSWRMEISRVGDWTVINDAYNANPTSMRSALRTTRELRPTSSAWAVLGEMAELGDLALEAHARVGRLAAALGYAGLVVVGDAAAAIASGAGGIAHRVSTIDEAADLVMQAAPPGSVVLVKASRWVFGHGFAHFPELLAAGVSRGVDA